MSRALATSIFLTALTLQGQERPLRPERADTSVRVCRPTNPPQCTPSLTPPKEGLPYFEFQVTTPARELPESPRPSYPEQLRAARVKGEVLAQFVVDTLGRVEAQTFKVLRASRDEFIAPVLASLPGLRYSPAVAGGRKVRQMVQKPFTFDPVSP